jgi:hypothetical protein
MMFQVLQMNFVTLFFAIVGAVLLPYILLLSGIYCDVFYFFQKELTPNAKVLLH